MVDEPGPEITRWHIRVLGVVLVAFAAGVIGFAALFVGVLVALAVGR